eukprot:gene3380-6705_t
MPGQPPVMQVTRELHQWETAPVTKFLTFSQNHLDKSPTKVKTLNTKMQVVLPTLDLEQPQGNLR